MQITDIAVFLVPQHKLKRKQKYQMTLVVVVAVVTVVVVVDHCCANFFAELNDLRVQKTETIKKQFLVLQPPIKMTLSH